MRRSVYPVRRFGSTFGVGASLGHDPETPTRPSVPTIVSKADVFDYIAALQPVVKSFDSDVKTNVIQYDPDYEHKQVEKYLSLAEEIDGCSGGLSCPGWKDGESVPFGSSPEAAAYRRQAFQHRVNARLAEDVIKAREEKGQKVSNAQIAKEVQIWNDWLLWLKSYTSQLKMIEASTIAKGSDYQAIQYRDVELQRFRNRYRNVVKLEPSSGLPKTVAESSGGIPWTWILVIATVGVGAWAIRETRMLGGLVKIGALT